MEFFEFVYRHCVHSSLQHPVNDLESFQCPSATELQVPVPCQMSPLHLPIETLFAGLLIDSPVSAVGGRSALKPCCVPGQRTQGAGRPCAQLSSAARTCLHKQRPAGKAKHLG